MRRLSRVLLVATRFVAFGKNNYATVRLFALRRSRNSVVVRKRVMHRATIDAFHRFELDFAPLCRALVGSAPRHGGKRRRSALAIPVAIDGYAYVALFRARASFGKVRQRGQRFAVPTDYQRIVALRRGYGYVLAAIVRFDGGDKAHFFRYVFYER